MQKRLTIKDLSQKRLKELLFYDPKTGVWIWKKDRKYGQIKKGSVAGGVYPNGYRYIGIDSKVYKANRLAFLYMLGYFPEHESEHKNRIKHDDRWENLREATHQCNMRNVGIKKVNTSGVVGISFNKRDKNWVSRIMISGKTIELGHHPNKLDAVKARWNAEIIFDIISCCIESSAFLYLKKKGILE